MQVACNEQIGRSNRSISSGEKAYSSILWLRSSGVQAFELLPTLQLQAIDMLESRYNRLLPRSVLHLVLQA